MFAAVWGSFYFYCALFFHLFNVKCKNIKQHFSLTLKG